MSNTNKEDLRAIVFCCLVWRLHSADKTRVFCTTQHEWIRNEVYKIFSDCGLEITTEYDGNSFDKSSALHADFCQREFNHQFKFGFALNNPNQIKLAKSLCTDEAFFTKAYTLAKFLRKQVISIEELIEIIARSKDDSGFMADASFAFETYNKIQEAYTLAN